MSNDQIHRELDHLFRRETGKMIAILTKVFGPSHMDLAENVVQEALLKATQVWPYSGIPTNPPAWIMQVAKNKALDLIRKDRLFLCDQNVLESIPDAEEKDEIMQASFQAEIKDDQLRLMFICCHPCLSPEVQIALTLKTVCGFSVPEISRAFLAKEETIAQRLVRAKQRIRDENLEFKLPEKEELAGRLDTVLDTIYLLFNEGYSAHSGDKLVKEDICLEACRLSQLLANHMLGNIPKVHALSALMFFQASRLKSRIDTEGEVLLLENQNRESWDQAMIAEGLECLSKASVGNELSQFHLLAGIAACHSTASSFAETDWQRILDYYEGLSAATNSPIITLNKAVAISFVKGPKAALKELEKVRGLPALKEYYLFPATKADFHRRLGETAKAVQFYREALALVGTEPEKRFLIRRLSECGVNINLEET